MKKSVPPTPKSAIAQPSNTFLRSVERALDALELLSRRRVIGISDLARIQKVGTSTAHRIMTTLEEKEFASRDAESGKYVLGHKVFDLTKAAINLMEPLKYVRPYLDRLCKECNENTIFAIVTRTKDSTVVVAEAIADNLIQIRSCLFERFPLHVSACGKAYLFTLSDEELNSLFSDYSWHKFTRHGPRTLRGLKAQLRGFREQGYTISKEEFMPGISSVGSAILNCEDNCAGGLAIIGPTSRLTDANIKHLGRLLRKVASQLSLQLRANAIL